MEKMSFNYNSLRARNARLGKVFGKPIMLIILALMVIVLIASGISLLVMRLAVGWICVGFTAIPLMLIFWTKKELVLVPVNPAAGLNGLLSNDVLAAIPRNPSAKDIAALITKTTSGKFMYVRYGLSPQLLEEIASVLPAEVGPIFQTAMKIQEETNSEEIHGAILAAAIIVNYPGHEDLLKRMKLDLADVLDGIVWFNYLNGLVKNINVRRHNGGIGRDLSFGYIPTLSRFGQNISIVGRGAMRTHLHLADHREIMVQMTNIFSNQGRQNVALVGPDGSGRATIVNAFSEYLMDADAKLPENLKYRQVFKLDAAAILSAAVERGQTERLVMAIMNEAYVAKNIILWLQNAELFFEDGTGSVDLSNVLLPVLEAGKLRIILTLDQQKFLEIATRKPALANALNRIMVKPANEKETMKVLQDQVPLLEFNHKVSYTIWALKEAYRLSERYVHDLEMPGRALSLLDSAGDYANQYKMVTAESVQQAVEKTAGVKVQQATSSDDRSKLLNMEELIHNRMVDQSEAVKTVADALRRSAAGVRNEKRPIGTFLFMGPTGVGKTELAKAVSEVYFDGEKNIVRVDLNEFVSAEDVSRLIADGAEDSMSLTAQVMKQPFSVVLLDEIEKAHPQVLTTLLQMLDEGILRDVKGREVSFRDTIVIATTNAASTDEFKPEFLNRFDEICKFKPLSPADCLAVLDLIIAGVNKTLAPQKISVELDQKAKELLVERGYDAKMGARPMKRIVQKSVENIVAKSMLAGQIGNGEAISISREMIEKELG